jgi:hypothetical protein
MRNTLRLLAVTALASAAVALTAGTAAAAPTAGGYDISYPQCGSTPPAGQAWGVVGVNGGLATTGNSCLPSQLAWAWQSSGTVPTQPKAQLYLNTANPGEIRNQVTTWPKSGATPYGTCTGGNTTACSWQYGWERAQNSVVSFFTPAARAARVDSQPSRYVWWLDVETVNTWQFGSAQAFENNRATLEGMTEYLLDRDAQVGIYSTHEQWSQIVGAVGKTSVLAGLDNWLAGSVTAREAAEACAEDPLVPGSQVALSQYVRDELDRNKSCR